MVPVFAFLAPAGVVISKWGYEYALVDSLQSDFVGCILALIIYKFGSDWIHVVLPPAAMGPVVALIGLELAGTAASNAGLKGRGDRSEECDRISCNFRSCSAWISGIP